MEESHALFECADLYPGHISPLLQNNSSLPTGKEGLFVLSGMKKISKESDSCFGQGKMDK
jgi:hypothetical protein